MTSANNGVAKMMRRLKIFNLPSWVGFSLAVFLFHHTVDAAQAQIYSGPVSSAMGGAGRAGAESTEIIFLNPTAAALGTGFEAGFHYSDGYWTKGQHESAMAVILVENNPENISPGGFAYIQKRRTLPGLAWSEKYYFGALGKTISPVLTIGLSGYYLEQILEDKTKFKQWNGSLGFLFTISPQLGVAYVLANPVAADEDVPLPLQPVTQHSLGVNWLMQHLMRVTLDVTKWADQNPDNRVIVQAGSEMKVGELALFRLGFEIDGINKRNSVTGGFGFIGPRLNANYSIAKPLKETDGAMHSVDLRLPF
jgi:hypothetical protein